MPRYINNRISKVDQFGIAAGVIGLIADFSSLSALFPKSSNEDYLPLFGWITIFVLILYSTMVINFFARRALFRRMEEDRFESSEKKRLRIESSVFRATLMICLPIMTVYFVAALNAYSKVAPSFIYLYDFIFVFFNLFEDFYILVCGIFYGSFLAFLIIYVCHSTLREFYKVLISSENIN